MDRRFRNLMYGLFFFICVAEKVKGQNSPNIEIEFSETYELANGILAITPYGKEDCCETQKGNSYYEKIMKRFEVYSNHLLIQKVNYSREKWESLLRFRTDAYAFEVNNKGKIQRKFPFFTNAGHSPFDDNLDLVQNFYEKSNFRMFYQENQAYYNNIAKNYSKYYLLEEMSSFLEHEFGKQKHIVKKLIVLSPLIGRMNCHRQINETTAADFPNLSFYFIESKATDTINQAQRVEDIHTIFTEMDHGFVNPATEKYSNTITKFYDYSKWDRKSGHTGLDCFNEYMTWAVYDVFAEKYFPTHARQTILNWHFQNYNRGFIMSNAFGEKLRQLYAAKKSYQAITDLYPAICDWMAGIQASINEPTVVTDTIVVSNKSSFKKFEIVFSETIAKMKYLDCVLFKVIDEGGERVKLIQLSNNKNFKIKKNRLLITITDIVLTKGVYGLIFNWWSLMSEVKSRKGIPLKSPSRFFFKFEG